MKKCRICEKNKEIDDFHKKHNMKDGHRNECKKCVKILNKKYLDKEKRKNYDQKRYLENKEKILNQKKKYFEKNKTKILEQKKEYRKNNKETINKWRKNNKEKLSKNQRKYRKENPHIIAWRTILYRVIKKFNTKKEAKTIEILKYSAEDLKNHMEKLFEKGMSWSNHGKWHIDHIKPVSKFNRNTPIEVVNALCNLQPLWEKDNLIKTNKY